MAQPKRQSFLEHLEELRGRLLASLAAIVVFTLVAYFFSEPLLEFLIKPLKQIRDYDLYFQRPYEAFLAHLTVSLLVGVLAASPVIFIELWLFVAPGLHQKERRVALFLSFISIFFFLGGAAFAYYVLVPLGLQFFLGFETYDLRPLLSIAPYFSFLVTLVLVSGMLFILPVVILGLVGAGILSAESLRKSRKFVIVVLFILAAVLTPSGDPASQVLLALPLYLLFELCGLLARLIEKRRKL